MSNENGSPEGEDEVNNQTNEVGKIKMPETKFEESKNKSDTRVIGKESQTYDYGYTITLAYGSEDGLMDTYLNGKLEIFNSIETINENEKPREDPSDWFNFGLDEDKWIKFLNKSILVHYERHLIQQQASENKMASMPGANIYPMQPFPGGNMPMRPMVPGMMPSYPYPMYRWPYPMMKPPEEMKK